MKRAFTLTLLASLSMSTHTFAADSADMVLTNAKIYGHQSADSIAIANGNILYICQSAESEKFTNRYTQGIDFNSA